METLQQIAAWIVALLLGGGTVTAFAFWLFKLFGDKWLTNKFAERLEAFKHDQQKEIEHLRFEISKLFDRTTKLHQREFEVVPKAWDHLADSYHEVRGVIASFRTYPDFERMSDEHTEEFLASSSLEKWQQDELRKKPHKERNNYYQDAIAWQDIARAKKTCRKSARYLLKNGIFMPPDLKNKFEKLGDLIWGALVEHDFNKQHDFKPKQHTDIQKLLKEGAPLMKELETEVQKRLWSSEIKS